VLCSLGRVVNGSDCSINRTSRASPTINIQQSTIKSPNPRAIFVRVSRPQIERRRCSLFPQGGISGFLRHVIHSTCEFLKRL
jgi:hypothetical protein